MKKKLLIFSMIMLFIITGCVNGKKSNNNNNENSEEQGLTKKVEGLSISIGDISVVSQAGGLDEKGNKVDEGKYFMYGEKLELSSEYKRIVVPVSFNNKNSTSYCFGVGGWKAYLNSAKYKNKLPLVSVTQQLNSEVKPNDQGEGNLYIVIKEELLKENDLILIYEYLNYNDEWQTAIQDYVDGRISYDEYKELYTPTNLEFKLKLD